MLKKNDIKIGKVLSVGNNGEGIVKDEDNVIFVPFALQGETIKYKILKVTSKCVYGKLLEVIEKSNDRTDPKCPVFGKCGGCQLQHANYSSQLKFKKEMVENAFRRVAFLDENVNDTVFSDHQYRYRNKIQLPVGDNNGELVIGFYAENSHRVIDIQDCPINPEWTSILIRSLKTFMLGCGLKGYNDITKTGDIREITAREVEGKLIITLVVCKKIPFVEGFVDTLKKNLTQEFSLFINYNDSITNKIYGDKFSLVYGKGEYKGNLLGIDFSMGVQSFMQVNSFVCEMLYKDVKNKLSANGNSVVIDAYSGAGLMTALLSKGVTRGIGIEIVKEAVELANQLAKENNLSHKITNYNGKCEELLPDIIQQEKKKNSHISLVLDPPRKGCDYAVLEAILKSEIDRIVYVSCMPSTLARDVGLLVGTLENKDGQIVKSLEINGKYKIESITPFDMFPQTKHVETLVVLQRK